MVDLSTRGARPQEAVVPGRKRRLGEYLLETGAVNEGQLREALRLHTQKRCSLGEALLSLGYVEEELVCQAVAHCSGLEYVGPEQLSIDNGADSLLPEAIARRHNILPVHSGEKLRVLAERPLPPQVVKSIERLAKRPLDLALASRSVIAEAMARVYAAELSLDVGGKTAIELVDEMITKAVQSKASDIHLEPFEHHIKLRYRVDGILQDVRQYPMDMLPLLTSRIKILSGMNIAERRSPQDGAIVHETPREAVDLRVSSLPCIHGEKVVMRILAGQASRLTVDEIGLSERDHQWFDRLI
jgi:type IV pilus assembly protein PilB